MKFGKLKLDMILGELGELPSDWMDDRARTLVEQLHDCVAHLRQVEGKLTVSDLARSLQRSAIFLDVCRLILAKGQESAAHMLCDQLGGPRMTWTQLRKLAQQDPARLASALFAIGIADVIEEHLRRSWQLEDVLIERYRMSRGRAIAGQRRGRSLEDQVEGVLRQAGAGFDLRATFVGKKGVRAKCDFAIPNKNHPKIVVEAKGFEATGSKLTDFLGDVLKIGEAKEYHMYFFLVTDGRGWHNRQSDLQKLVDYQNEGLIDMIYTLSRLSQLAADVEHICESE